MLVANPLIHQGTTGIFNNYCVRCTIRLRLLTGPRTNSPSQRRRTPTAFFLEPSGWGAIDTPQQVGKRLDLRVEAWLQCPLPSGVASRRMALGSAQPVTNISLSLLGHHASFQGFNPCDSLIVLGMVQVMNSLNFPCSMTGYQSISASQHNSS